MRASSSCASWGAALRRQSRPSSSSTPIARCSTCRREQQALLLASTRSCTIESGSINTTGGFSGLSARNFSFKSGGSSSGSSHFDKHKGIRIPLTTSDQAFGKPSLLIKPAAKAEQGKLGPKETAEPDPSKAGEAAPIPRQTFPKRPPLASAESPPVLKKYLYASPTAWNPHEDYELPDGPSQLETTANKATSRHPARAHVSVIVDGDNLLFRKDLVDTGFQGGKSAAALVKQYVKSNLAGSLIVSGKDDIDVRATIVCNFVDLQKTLETKGGVQPGTFAEFQQGWLHGGPFFSIIDAGRFRQAADTRVRAHLVDSVLDSDCVHVYLGGLDDYGYANELVGLRKLGMLEKVSLLQAPNYIIRSKWYAAYEQRLRGWPRVFSDNRKDYPLLKALESAHLAQQADGTQSDVTDKRKPCIEHHLLGSCTRRNCYKSHEPLSPQELFRLRRDTKRTPCPAIARDEPCDLGADLCPYGH